MTSDVVRRRVVVRGRVQGVFFRDSCRRVAHDLGVTGWVRNRADGSVEAHVQGDARAVDRLIDACVSGPPGSRVERIEVTPGSFDAALSAFTMAHTR